MVVNFAFPFSPKIIIPSFSWQQSQVFLIIPPLINLTILTSLTRLPILATIFGSHCNSLIKNFMFGWARWLMPVIPELWGPRWADH